MSKLTNAKKRFRQGRITHKQLAAIMTKEREEILANMKTIVDRVEARQSEEHIHGEHCNHPEINLTQEEDLTVEEVKLLEDDGLTLDTTPLPEHICSPDHGNEEVVPADCDHEHHQSHPHQHHHPRD
jgi:hypothetical protein